MWGGYGNDVYIRGPELMEKVYVVRCESYGRVEEKTAELINLMGGMQKYARPGEKIVLKPNLLAASDPDKSVTTHPAIVAAVAQLTKETGAEPLIAESPGSGYPYTEKTLQKTYRATGMSEAASSAGIPLNFDTSHEIVSFPEGERFKRFEIISPLLRADAVFNLCKLKTHSFMHMTGAVKNCFGVITGLTKPGYHAKLQDKSHFANMLLDLAAYVAPRVSILDAVVAMEGNGPQSGDIRPVGLLLASTGPLALDVVAGEIMGLPKASNPVLVEAERRGMVPVKLDQIELVGIETSELRVPDFKLPSTVPKLHNRLFGLLYPVVKRGFSVQPRILVRKCVSCGSCRDACPVKVITVAKNTPARIDRSACIRCYCCHEMCPHDAIELRSGFLYRLLNRG
jgi:uncharacterized protein (DUF362 family)/NAD-dependent dihydropyrimidine dehydrogenase PreA subunit